MTIVFTFKKKLFQSKYRPSLSITFAIFLATDRFRDKKIEYPSKQFNLRHPLKLSTTLNIYH